MMALAPHTGRQQAHDLVYSACRVVNDRGGTLAEALAQVPEVTRHFEWAEINRLTDPANYLGSATQMVNRVLTSLPRDR
jgi:3-carboxy-cis,cis-muconate cycloisomerase